MSPQSSLLRLARTGDVDACCWLAHDLMRPETDDGYRAALPWLRRAANAEPWAAYHLGFIFNHGRGVRKSIARAIAWYTRAVEGGYDSAQLNVGIIYANLPGRRRDLQRALSLYRAAARQGNRNAMYNLGLYNEEGRGDRPSRARAIHWYQRAAAKGHRSARAKLRRLNHGGA